VNTVTVSKHSKLMSGLKAPVRALALFPESDSDSDAEANPNPSSSPNTAKGAVAKSKGGKSDVNLKQWLFVGNNNKEVSICRLSPSSSSSNVSTGVSASVVRKYVDFHHGSIYSLALQRPIAGVSATSVSTPANKSTPSKGARANANSVVFAAAGYIPPDVVTTPNNNTKTSKSSSAVNVASASGTVSAPGTGPSRALYSDASALGLMACSSNHPVVKVTVVRAGAPVNSTTNSASAGTTAAVKAGTKGGKPKTPTNKAKGKSVNAADGDVAENEEDESDDVLRELEPYFAEQANLHAHTGT